MSFDLERLYALLPAHYRVRDLELARARLTAQDRVQIAEWEEKLAGLADPQSEEAEGIRGRLEEKQRGPLKALLAVIAEQIAGLEENLLQLYDDQFIETCAEWVVPYIGDLVGARGLFVFPEAAFSQRAQVANTLAYRRRKGTATVLEQLAHDVTGWPARVVEYFLLLATTQYLNHLRPPHRSVADLRDCEALEQVNTPFDRSARNGDVRRIETRRGKYNIPHIGLHLWRLQSFPLLDSTPYPVDDRRYCFDALGRDVPLYNRPEREDEITHLATPLNVPGAITRGQFRRALEAYYGIDKSMLLKVDGSPVLPGVPGSPPTSPPHGKLSDLITVCYLGDITDAGGNVLGWANMPTTTIALDPELGRIAFPSLAPPPQQVQVTYHYGFSAALGGGGYARPGLPQPTRRVDPGGLTLAQALAAVANEEEVIEIGHSGKIEGDLAITLSPAQKLTIQAKSGQRPVVWGALQVAAAQDAELIVDGLLITGGIEVAAAPEMRLSLAHCTLPPWLEKAHAKPKAPAQPAVKWTEPGSGKLTLARTICGRIITGPDVEMEMSDSIVDGLQEDMAAIAGSEDNSAAAGTVKVHASTILGTVFARQLDLGENSIFAGKVISVRKQQGCLRFSYISRDSETPRRYHCQPDLAMARAADELRKQKPDLSPSDLEALAREVEVRVQPVFASRTFGHPAYLQLHRSCPGEIWGGADDEAEMGAFHFLYQPQREANLRAQLLEYLRFGLEAGIFYAS